MLRVHQLFPGFTCTSSNFELLDLRVQCLRGSSRQPNHYIFRLAANSDSEHRGIEHELDAYKHRLAFNHCNQLYINGSHPRHVPGCSFAKISVLADSPVVYMLFLWESVQTWVLTDKVQQEVEDRLQISPGSSPWGPSNIWPKLEWLGAKC
jgi:hypothetical protein